MTDSARQPAAGWIERIGAAVGLGWLARLAGPIFDKELRVSARRRRNYALRFCYLLALTAFMLVVWVRTVGAIPNLGFSHEAEVTSRMAMAGEHIAWRILDLQFFVLPLIVAVMLSASVVEEIRQRTLATLMVTPVSSFGIAAGKLCSKLLQVMLLLAISLPLLMVVRVLGGVDWQKVVAALVVTATTCLTMGSLSLLMSTFFRRGYMAVGAALGLVAAFCLFLTPGWIDLLPSSGVLWATMWRLMAYLNPAWMMHNRFVSYNPINVRLSVGAMGPWTLAWYVSIHALVAIGASLVMVAWAGRRMRKIGLGLAMLEAKSAARWGRLMRPRALTRRSEADPIRRVTGSPVLWRERQVRFGLGRFAGVVVWAFIGGTAIALDSVAIWMAGNFTADGLCLGVSVMLLVATMLVATIQSGPALAAEREAGTLSLLLTTPLGAGRIVYEKALGAMRHSMPVWGLLLAHVIVVVAVGFFHPILVLHVALILAGVLVMVTGIGMLIGAWVRRAATAAMLNLLVMGVVFAGPPAVVMALAEYGPSGGGNAEYSLYVFHPVSQIVMASEGASYATQSGFDGRRHRVLSYDLGPRLRIGKSTEAGWAYVTMLLILTSGVQVGVGVAAGALAVRRLRRTGG